MTVVISQIVLFIILVYTSFMITRKERVSNFTKVVVALSTIGVLAFDKVKLMIWLIGVGVMWIFHNTKKRKSNGFKLE
jgi:hypothetical protein